MKKLRINKRIIIVLIIVAIASSFMTAIFLDTSSYPSITIKGEGENESFSSFELSLDGYTKVDVNISLMNLSFSSDCYKLAMTITDDQAYSIYRGIENNYKPRPMTHDLMIDVFDNMGIKVITGRIETVDDDKIYHARLYLQKGNKVLSLDSRPSDMAGISVRANNNVYVNQTILEKYGEYMC